MAGKEGTVAPRERVNIVYKSSVGDAQEEVELPLRFIMLGDYTGRQDSTPLEDRKPIDINKDNFNDVLRSQNISVTAQVANKLVEKDGEEMPVTLKFSHMKDFEPEAIVNQVPELKKLLELRQAMNALKGPLGNLPEFRKKIQTIIGDKAAREKLAAEISGGKKE
ncbi:MAG TPA: type VI secretion system contractile sheath small subunit [Planctomycetota bacterium]|jgi:type VI secretion system protein ImpB|nr:type VI secretion system contractile sheath small subunit [Planctomycetota bacterium]